MPGTPKERRMKIFQDLVSRRLYDGESFEDFEADFSSPEGQKSLYDFIAKEKLYSKKFEDFQAQFYADVNEAAYNEKKKGTSRAKRRSWCHRFRNWLARRIATGECRAAIDAARASCEHPCQ